MDEKFEIVEDVWKDCPKSIPDLEALSLYSILIVIAGYISIGIGTFHFILTMVERFRPLGILHWLVNLIFGFGLLVAYYRMEENKKTWSVLTFVFSVVLLALGGIVGGLAGFIALIGAVLAFLSTTSNTYDI